MRRARQRTVLVALSIAGLALLTACPQREVSVINPDQAKETEKLIPVEINRDIDILFVIDNSGSMEEEQQSLAANFSRFINVLQTIEGGLPNVHIGVVSSDVGAGPYNIMNCDGAGDNGALQSQAQGACEAPMGNYISDVADEQGNRVTNYNGTLEDTFSCIAQLGISGCGFEQQLESMRRALNGSNPTNQGFLRENAFLAVIFITDEDDCSTEDTSMFDTSQNSIDTELGFLDSYRCFEFGVQCEPDSRTQAGPRQNCIPRPDSQYMFEVQEYVDFLKGLKPDPGLIITAGIMGNPSPVEVQPTGDENQPQLQPSCVSNSGEADPAVRLKAFLESFPGRNTSTTICNEDLSDALTQVADLLKEVVGNPCLEGPLRLEDGQPFCTVEDVRHAGTDRESRTLLRKCSSPSNATGEAPCWYVEQDTDNCDQTETGLALVVERGSTNVPTGTSVEVRCELD